MKSMKTKNKICLVIDSNALCYRSLYTIGGLSHDRDRTGVIFGFLNQVFRYAKAYKTNDIIFCWDSKESLRRMICDENYKLDRIKKKEVLSDKEKKNLFDAFRQFDLLRKEVLFDLGFRNVFHRRGYESDDLIAIIVNEKGKEYLIIANDNDLWQLIEEGISYLGLRDGKIITKESFFKKYGLHPNCWSEVKAIAGCKGDNVVGIKGIGEKKAIDFIHIRSKPNDRRKIEGNWETVVHNRKLVYLPFENNIKLEIRENDFTSDKFVDVFNRYAFKSFLEHGYFNKLMEVFCD